MLVKPYRHFPPSQGPFPAGHRTLGATCPLAGVLLSTPIVYEDVLTDRELHMVRVIGLNLS